MHIYNIDLYLVSFFRMSQKKKSWRELGTIHQSPSSFPAPRGKKEAVNHLRWGKPSINDWRWSAIFWEEWKINTSEGVNTICGLMSKIYQMLCMYISKYNIRYNYRYVYIYIIYHISCIIYHISYITYIYICTCSRFLGTPTPPPWWIACWFRFHPSLFMGQKWMKSWRDDLGKQKYHLFLQSIPCLFKKTNYQYLTFP